MEALVARHIERFKRKGDPSLRPKRAFDKDQLDPGTVGIFVPRPNANGELVDTLIGQIGTTDRGAEASQAAGVPRWLEAWSTTAWTDLQSPIRPLRIALKPTQTTAKPAQLTTGPTMVGNVEYNYQPLNAETAGSAQFNAVKAVRRQLFELRPPEGLQGHLHRTWLEDPNLVHDVWVLRPGYMPPSQGRDLLLKPVPSPYADAGAFATDMNRQRGNQTGWLLVTALYYFVQA